VVAGAVGDLITPRRAVPRTLAELCGVARTCLSRRSCTYLPHRPAGRGLVVAFLCPFNEGEAISNELEAYSGRRPVRHRKEVIVDAIVSSKAGVDSLERETIKRVAWRLLPLLMLGYFSAYLDRVNVGIAGLTMNQQLGFSGSVFGFGSGLFFVGYFLAEIPSNLILNKVGARRWIARILITWGIISGLTAFVWDEWSFYGVRFILGLAEAGFYPGVVLYLTWWFPSNYRTRMIAIVQSASLISLIIGPPISGMLLHLDGALGLHGWQWLFLLEALPPVIMCVVTWQLLTDLPTEAN
jgi:sugar phosphate permease